MIYLDNAATTLHKPTEVRDAMLDAFDTCANPGRGAYSDAMNAAERVYNAREKISRFFGVDNPSSVVFTQNATHALNIAIKGIAEEGHCVISGYEHNSVARPVEKLARRGVLSYSVAEGRVFDAEDMLRQFMKNINAKTKFCVCSHVSNVFGYILPIKELDHICYLKGIPLIIDASQSAGSIKIELGELKATVCICAPGHKGLYGPQGTGVLICREGKLLDTLIEGGTGSGSAHLNQPDFMPDRHESGTQNTPGIAGLSAGIDYINRRGMKNILAHEQDLIRYAARELTAMGGIKVFYANDRRLQGGVLSFLCREKSCDEIASLLGKKGIAVRSGLHCSPLAHGTTGTSDGTVRISVSDFTSENDVFTFLRAMYGILKK